MNFSVRLATCLALFGMLYSFETANAADIEDLKRYEGVYQLLNGEYQECLTRQYVELIYNHNNKHLALNPLDNQIRRRGWGWMDFVPINQGSQLNENFFALSRYNKSVAKETKEGWTVERLQRDCQLRLFCGRWQNTQSILLTDQTLEIRLLQDTQRCTYRRINSPVL